MQEPPASAKGCDEIIAEAKAKRIPPAEQLNAYTQVLRASPTNLQPPRRPDFFLSGTERRGRATWRCGTTFSPGQPAISLPLMAEIATRPDHPLAAAASRLLKLALRENYPDDPGKLRQAVERFSFVR